MTDLDRLRERAHFLFKKLAETAAELSERGERVAVLTRPNGHPEALKIAPGHPTTPQVDRIREEKRLTRS